MRNRSLLARREALAFYGFISPWIIGFICFTGGPIIASLYFSLTNYTLLSSPHYIGLGNYTALFNDPLFSTSLYNTFYYTVFFVPLGIIFSFMLALLLNQKVGGLAAYRTVYYLPSIVPAVANSILWIWLLNPQWGLINTVLRMVGIEGPGWLTSEVWSKPAIILMSLWGVGSWVIIFLAGLQGVPEQYYEAAEVDGATTLARFFHITLPLMTPTIFFTLITGTNRSAAGLYPGLYHDQRGAGQLDTVLLTVPFPQCLQLSQDGLRGCHGLDSVCYHLNPYHHPIPFGPKVGVL